jgi:hypothetical protein
MDDGISCGPATGVGKDVSGLMNCYAGCKHTIVLVKTFG